MGGEASKTLTDEVTHLIAGEVGSKKYQVIILIVGCSEEYIL
jgi:hypothetical protein